MSNLIAFPERPRAVEVQQAAAATAADYRRQHAEYCASLAMPTPGPTPVLRMSSWSKWRLTRAIQADTSLSASAVLVAVHLIDWWSEKNAFAAPSAAKLCNAARLHSGADRRPNMPALHRAIDELTARGWFRWDFHEYKPGTGFPGRKFIVMVDLNE